MVRLSPRGTAESPTRAGIDHRHPATHRPPPSKPKPLPSEEDQLFIGVPPDLPD